MAQGFVHLHVHTEYSLVDSVVRIKPLMQTVADYGMPAVALTDCYNLFALVKFYRAAEHAGLKPIIGADLLLETPAAEAPARVVVLCQNNTGYANLTHLLTCAYLEGQVNGVPVVRRDGLAARSDGLLALLGPDSEIGRTLLTGHRQRTRECLAFWQQHFPERCYLELHRLGAAGEAAYLEAALTLAQHEDMPVVATNKVRFLHPTDYEMHEVRVCIQEGRTLADPRRARTTTPEQYLRTPEEMAQRFADIPQALVNSVEIAKRCSVTLRIGETVLPDFPLPKGQDAGAYLRERAREGLDVRLGNMPVKPERRIPYQARLTHELEVITQMGFAGYFLIVADFIQWAREHGVPVGPGRGSGAGSLVAYSLKITDLDPLQYNLLFERFLNPERVSMPDFDVDFCMEGRDRVIDYVADRYGRDRVAQIITYGSMAAKAVVRDVGRVLGYPYGFVDRIAKAIPFEVGMTLDRALAQDPTLAALYREDEEVRTLVDMARRLEGLVRNAGRHAGGVVIAPSPLTDFMPLYCESGGEDVVTQLDKDDVEVLGLVKFDFLGLRTLTIIDWTLQAVNAQRQQDGKAVLMAADLPLDDLRAFELLKRCQTAAVFQLESRGMRDLLSRLQPDRFEDIVALVALFRPGPLQSGMVDDFINRKHGRALVDYPHPLLEPILKPTYGVILYQEQVMQIAQVLAGYTLGSADLLRRAMGKKKPEEMARQRTVFVTGAVERGVDEATATAIFDLMEKFAGYGFNRSHSAAYALLAYQTAWLKAHVPAAFMAAVLSSDMDHTDKVVDLIEECRMLKLKIVPPDVNQSQYAFTAMDAKTILYGLGAIKGVGLGAVEGLLAARGQGHFKGLDDLCRRVDLSRLNRRALEALIRAGALDGLGVNRATLMQRLEGAIRLAERYSDDQDAGQVDLFGGVVAAGPQALVEGAEWDEEVRLAGERETMGIYLTGHPITRYEAELAQMTTGLIHELASTVGGAANGGRREAARPVTVAGWVINIRTRSTQAGRMALVTLEDRSGRIEVGVFADDYRRYGDTLIKDCILVIEGRLGFDEFSRSLRLRAHRVFDLDQARAHFAKRMDIALKPDATSQTLVASLAECLTPYRDGQCSVVICYNNGQAQASLKLDDDWRIAPTQALLNQLRTLRGVDDVILRYR